MTKKYIFIFIIFNTHAIFGQTIIKTMFYNLLNYPTAPPENRNLILKEILNIYEPDIFMVCELENSISADNILTYSLNDIDKNYSKAQFITNQSDTSVNSSLQQLIYFNTDFLILDSQTTILTNIRDINHYTFILKTDNYLTNPTYLHTFVTHLKASQGGINESLRLQMVNEFISELNNLPSNSYVIFAGDFNFYTSSEDGYQQLLNSNNAITLKDPLNLNNTLQSWHNNNNWSNIHTQSTRISTSGFNGFGASGGLDDRFDFILLSENIMNNSNINYVTNSYKSFGNNGNCFNSRIDNSNCNGGFNQTLRNNLYQMSDHLPVVLELETNQTLSLPNSLINAKLISFMNGNIIKDNLFLLTDKNLFDSKLDVYNSLGQILYSIILTSSELRIDTSSFPRGIYYIKNKKLKTPLKFLKF